MGYISSYSSEVFTVTAEKNVRIMTFSSYYAHTAPIFKDLKILTIDKLIVHRIGVTMYKYGNGLLPDVSILFI